MKRMSIVGGLFLLGLLAGCAAPEPAAPEPVPAKPQALDELANGKTIGLCVGEVVRVRLHSNPTTGFSWEFRAPGNGVIALDKNAFIPPENKNNMCGVPGAHELVIRAVKPGSAELRGVYRRPWEKRDPAFDKAFRLNFEVK